MVINIYEMDADSGWSPHFLMRENATKNKLHFKFQEKWLTTVKQNAILRLTDVERTGEGKQ